MERKIRERINTLDAKTLLIKLLPLLFLITLILITSSMTGAVTGGPMRPDFE